jgi:NADH-quinone oxidoreductase subunit N
MTLTTFAVVANNSRDWDEGERMAGFAGLGQRRPWLAGSMTVALISLAGLPPTSGFMGKLTIITALVDGNWTWLGFAIVLGSLVSLVYYLRVIALMWFKPAPETAPARSRMAPEVLAAFVAVTTAVLTIGTGILPSWPLDRAAEIGAKISSPPR